MWSLSKRFFLGLLKEYTYGDIKVFLVFKEKEVIGGAVLLSYNDFVENDGWVNSKTNGKMRLEGKDYIVKDGDVLNFRFNTWPDSLHTEIN